MTLGYAHGCLLPWPTVTQTTLAGTILNDLFPRHL